MGTEGNNTQGEPIEILSIDDTESDQFVLELILSARKKYHLSFVTDGIEAVTFLNRQEIYASAPRPDLIILDLNLPKKDGHEVLVEIRKMESLAKVPVLMFSSSCYPLDRKKCRALGGNAYLTKPTSLDDYDEVVKVIELLCSKSESHLWIESTATDAAKSDPSKPPKPEAELLQEVQ